ncbi:MAG TPA: helix-turn-helix domain-containing protein [Longimicrobiales bacterium]|nr:helix-turn-helix domain-containing protein [Longimicrobiales bacterium]
MTIGERLTEAREASGYHELRELARAIKAVDPDAPGADHTSIGNYESGRSQPKSQWLAAFCAVTDTDANWLLTGRGQRKRRRPEDPERRLRAIEQIAGGDDEGGMRTLFESWDD